MTNWFNGCHPCGPTLHQWAHYPELCLLSARAAASAITGFPASPAEFPKRTGFLLSSHKWAVEDVHVPNHGPHSWMGNSLKGRNGEICASHLIYKQEKTPRLLKRYLLGQLKVSLQLSRLSFPGRRRHLCGIQRSLACQPTFKDQSWNECWDYASRDSYWFL